MFTVEVYDITGNLTLFTYDVNAEGAELVVNDNALVYDLGKGKPEYTFHRRNIVSVKTTPIPE